MDFKPAAELVRKAKKILVVSHYDCDGLCSAKILSDTLKRENKNFEQRIFTLEKHVEEIETKLTSFNSDETDKRQQVTKKISIKEFLLAKQVDNDVKRTLAIAYFLEKIEKMESFNIEDLKKHYRLAKEQLPSNPNDKVNMAIKGGYIMEATEKKDAKKAWTLTATGERFVENNFKNE